MSALPAPGRDAGPSAAELIVLNAVRLGGFANTQDVVPRAALDAGTTEKLLIDLAGRRLVDRLSFGGTGGWILTDAGKEHLTTLLAEERAPATVHAVLVSTADGFEDLNTRLVRTLTQWQLGSPAEQSRLRDTVLRELTDLADALGHLLADLASRLPRFARYPSQFTAAVQKVRAGEDRWVAGVGILSCHTVWAELHQDLLSSLGRARTAGPGSSGR